MRDREARCLATSGTRCTAHTRLYRDHDFLAAYAVHRTDREIGTAEVAAFLTERALVTVRKDPGVDLRPVLRRWDAAPVVADAVLAFLVHGLVDVLVAGYQDVVQVLDEEGDALEAGPPHAGAVPAGRAA